MLSSRKFAEICRRRQVDRQALASQLVRGGLNEQQALRALRNWQRGLLKPIPRREDIRNLAAALTVEVNDLVDWRCSYRFAPISARKARAVTQVIAERRVQDAMDILKFTRKRAAGMIAKVLKTAVADADEQEADVDNLYVSQARVDDAGIRVGTKRWMPKDRGRSHPIRKKACHIHVTVTQM